MLSERLSIALCTNPPIPFVGDTRPEVGGAGMSVEVGASLGASYMDDERRLVVATSDIEVESE
jgi:hypothetical protein